MKYKFRRFPPSSDRGKNTTPMKEAIHRMLASMKLDEKYSNAVVLQSWEKVMGNTIATRTGRIFMKKRVLYVEITSAPLRSEIKHHKQKVVTLLNDHVGNNAVSDLVLL